MAQSPLTSSQVLGHYALSKKLGVGAMGEVWLAHDKLLDREVAIKLLHPGASNERMLKDFLREARAAAKLNHPNTVTIHQIGKTGDRVYIAMEYVEGGSLADELENKGALSWREATQAIRDAAAGLKAAHEQGLVHRDIKPSNLMRASSGIVKVVDFGLAKSRDGNVQATMTMPGTILGSPAYMSPEQCRGETADARSDLYSLICAYYQLLTRQTPFAGTEMTAVMYQHCHQPFPDIHEKEFEAPEGVCRILAKGSRKKPEERYQTAAELIADLDVVLHAPAVSHIFGRGKASPSAQSAIAAWSISVGPILKGKGITSKVAWSLVILILACLLTQALRKHAHRSGDEPPKPEVATANSLPNVVTSPPVGPQPLEPPAAVPQPPVRIIATELPSHTDAEGHRVLDLIPIIDADRCGSGCWKREGADLTNAYGVERLTIPYQPPEEYDFTVEFEIRNQLPIAIFTETVEHAGRDITWDVRSKTPTETEFGFGRVSGIEAHDPRNPTYLKKVITFVANKRYTSLIQVRKGAVAAYLDQELLIQYATDFSNITFSPLAGGLPADGLAGGGLGFLFRNSLSVVHKIELTEISGKGHYVPPPVDPHLVHSYSMMDSDHSLGPRTVQFTPDGRSIIFMARAVTIWDRASGKVVSYWHNDELNPALQIPTAMSADGRFVAATLRRGETHVVDTAHPQSSKILNGAHMGLGAFSPDGSRLAVVRDAIDLTVWDHVQAKILLHADTRADGQVAHVAFSPDGLRLLCIHHTTPIGAIDVLWDARTLTRLWSAQGGEWPFFSHDGTKIITDKKIVLNAADGKVVSDYTELAGQNQVSPDGKLVIVFRSFYVGGWRPTVCDTATGTELDRFKNPKIPPVTAATWSADGRWLLVGCVDYTMRLIDVKTGDELANYGFHPCAGLAAAISPDGKFAASASLDSKIRVFSLPVK